MGPAAPQFAGTVVIDWEVGGGSDRVRPRAGSVALSTQWSTAIGKGLQGAGVPDPYGDLNTQVSPCVLSDLPWRGVLR